jgi:hypothetical protein
MLPSLRRRIAGRSVSPLAFGAAWVRAVTRSMGRPAKASKDALGDVRAPASCRCSATGAMAPRRGWRPRALSQKGEAALIRLP